MSEILGEIEQVKNFIRGGREILNMEGERNLKQTFFLAGIQTIIPQEIFESGFLHNPSRQTVLKRQINHQVRLNDIIDFQGADNGNIQDLIQETADKETEAKHLLDESIDQLPEGEREGTRMVIENSVQEVKFVEEWIREKQNAKNISLVDVDTYRSLTNIISIVASVSTIFGPEVLANRTAPLDNKNLTIQDILDKYAWVFGTSPENNIERAIMIMFHTVMDGQLSDDWHDKYIDKAMHVPSFGRIVARMNGGNKKLAERDINRMREEHRAKARELGLGRIATHGVSKIISLAEAMKKRSVNGAKRFGKTPPLTIRERAYAEGRFDK